MDRLKFEGFMYNIVAYDSPQKGLFVFERHESEPKISGTYRQVTGNMADLRDGDTNESFKILPWRCAPLLAPRISEAEANGVFAEFGITPRAFFDAIQAHPLYLIGRDDLAEARISNAFGITLSQRLPEGFIPSSLI